MIDERLFFAPVRELGELLRTRRVTSVELTEGYLDRLERFGPRLAAVVTVTRELALAEAHRAHQEILAGRYRGPLHGIPYGAKDLLATRGIPTTWGAEPYRRQVFDHDAVVIERLREAGAVLCAKLAMIELAGGLGYNNADASFTGPCRNPWNADYWSGGSSSGSGAAVAAGLVSFAIGSETSGSILCPAAFCGLTGLRPTYGLVPRHGAMALCWSLDKLGPLCRNADDCGLVLQAIAGPDPRDPSSRGTYTHPKRSPAPTAQKRFRLGVVKGATLGAEPEVAANLRRAVEVLGRLATIDEDVEFPDHPYSDSVELIVAAEGGAAFRDLIESGAVRELRDPADRLGGYAALLTPAVDYLQAQRLRVEMRADLEKLLSRYDALVGLGYGVAFPVGPNFDAPAPGAPPQPAADSPRPPSIVPAGNLAGLPAIGLPTGFGRAGLPTTLQLLGRAQSEATLVSIADGYQGLTDWHRRQPPPLP